MTTKAKCMALAKEHDIEVYIHKTWGNEYEVMLSCPDGYQLEDWDGARTGLSMCGITSAKELWREVWSDLQTMLSYQPWFKIPEGGFPE